MKILHVITSLRTGGAEKLMVDLLPKIRDFGCDVELLLIDGTPTLFKEKLESKGIKIFDLGIGGSLYSPVKFGRLLKFLRNNKYDIIHTHLIQPQIYCAIARVISSAKFCTTEHNTTNSRRNWKWYAPIDRYMYNQYDSVICISDKTKDLLIDFIGKTKAKIDIVYNGIDTNLYKNATTGDLEKENYGCSIALIQVAAFRHQKDQDTSIKALCHLPESYHLYLVGDGVRRRDLEELSKTLGVEKRVHFLGIRKDVPNLLKASDIVIMSSHWEGFGLAAVEGMAAGKPVIASDVDGLKQVVEGAGILFSPGDDMQLAQIIEELTGFPDKQMSIVKNCQRKAKNYDILSMADKYFQIYQDLIPLSKK